LGQKYNYFVWTNRLSAEHRETSKNREGGRGRERARERGEAMVVGFMTKEECKGAKP
jgi:hypothetical protein